MRAPETRHAYNIETNGKKFKKKHIKIFRKGELVIGFLYSYSLYQELDILAGTLFYQKKKK